MYRAERSPRTTSETSKGYVGISLVYRWYVAKIRLDSAMITGFW